MTRLDAAVLAEFLAALRQCVPTGGGGGRPPPPPVAFRTTADGLTLSGGVAGVGLSRHLPGPGGDAAFAVPAHALQAVARDAAGEIEWTPTGAAGVRASWSGGGREVPAVDPAPAPAVVLAADWQPAGADFVRALRDAGRAVRREPDARYAYHRVLLDAPAGKVVATDGVNLFVHGGFGWTAPGPAAVPAVGVWAAGFWARAGDPAVAVGAAAVGVRAGPWAVTLPVDRAARFPAYGDLLARLRVPAARVTLTAADAAAWAAGLAAWAAADGPDEPVVLALADPPTLTRGATGPAGRLTAAGSAFAGRRAVRATTARAPLGRALALGFRTLTAVGVGHPLVALDGPRRYVWAALDPAPVPPRSAPRPGPTA